MHFSVWKGHLKQNYLWIFCVLIIMCYVFLIGNWFSNWCILNLTSKPWGYKMWENIAAVWWKSFINQDIFSVPALLSCLWKEKFRTMGLNFNFNCSSGIVDIWKVNWYFGIWSSEIISLVLGNNGLGNSNIIF